MLNIWLTRIRRSSLAKNAAWVFAGDGLSLIVQALYFVILARLLGPTQYGLLAGVVALSGVVSQYSSLGSGLLFLRHVSADHSRSRLYWGNILISVLLMGGALVLLLRIASNYLVGHNSIALVVPIAVGDCIFLQFNSSAAQVLQTFERMKISAAITLATNMLRLMFAIGMLLLLQSASAEQWAYAQLTVSSIAAAIAFSVVTQKVGWPHFSFSSFRKHLGEGSVFAVSGSTTAVYNDIDKVVLAHQGMDHANGIYSLAYRAINIGTMPIQALARAALPRFFRVGVRGTAATAPMARRLLAKTAFLGAIVSVGLFLSAPIIPHLIGSRFSEAVSALRWLCLIPLFRAFHLTAGDAIAGAGHQKFRLLSQSIAAVGNLLLNLYLIPRYSWLGAAWASLVTDAGLGAMNWFALMQLKKRDGVALPLAEEVA